MMQAAHAKAMLAQAETVEAATRLSIFEGYVGVLVVAFLGALLATPLMRRVALANGIIDKPDQARKIHTMPIAYLGGVAVFVGLMAGVLYSFVGVKVTDLIDWHATKNVRIIDFASPPVPYSILLGMTVILLVGVIDDVTGISPRVKIGGQLFAAAALAMDKVGVQLAAGLMLPVAKTLGIPTETIGDTTTILLKIPLPVAVMGMDHLSFDVIYWTGTAIIAVAVIGLCNASNLIDGLDGLLSGTTAIAAAGLLVVSLGLALADDGPRDHQRIVLCLALLGACLGFLPHNFNPATIFLGDAGSLLLGFVTCVVILMLGDTGKTSLVAAGVIIYALPIIDTTLAIVRRKMEGKPISAPDDQHLHHLLKRALGVKGAVFALYGIAATFAVIGASVALIRARSVMLLAMIIAAYVGVTAIKIARRRAMDAQAAAIAAGLAAGKANGKAGPAPRASTTPEGGPSPVKT